MHRALELNHTANHEKIITLKRFAEAWRSALTCAKQDKIAYLKTTGKIHRFNKEHWTIGKPDFLTARQFKSVENQVNAALKSWVALAQKESFRVIRSWDIPDEERTRLIMLTKQKLWWTDPLGEEIIHDVLKTTPFPVFTSLSIRLDDLVCAPGESAEGYWLRLRVFGEKLDIPVQPSPYYLHRMNAGRECSVSVLSFPDDSMVIHRMVEIEDAELRTAGADIGIDWGLATLLTTSDGDCMGRRLYSWLQKMDDQLQQLTASLQQQGIPLKKSQRYQKLNHRIRQYVTNEVNRVLNRIASWDIKSISVEKLDFRGGGLSGRMNRILSRAGRNAFKNKLGSLEEEYGIEVTEVNPAYTSQTCTGCGYVDKRNRVNQETFSCVFCGKTRHADVNAARNILHRRSFSDDGLVYTKKDSVLSFLDNIFMDSWSMESTVVRQRSRKRPVHAVAVPLGG